MATTTKPTGTAPVAPAKPAGTPAQPAQQATAPTQQQAQQASALGLPVLLAKAQQAAVTLAAWVAGTVAGRRTTYTVQGAYHAALAMAVAANNGHPVAPGMVASAYLALGGVAPGRSNASGYGASRGLTLWHSAMYGANKHLVGRNVVHAGSHVGGATLYTVPAPVLASVQATVPAPVLAALAGAMQANLAAALLAPCGCNTKGRPCASARKVGAATYSLAAPATTPTPTK